MTSEKQSEANKQNGKKGGPKTEAGKDVSKMNALKHGMLSKQTLLSREDSEELEKFSKRMRKALQPQNELERFLVDRIISLAWRLRRGLRFEKKIIDHYHSEDRYPPPMPATDKKKAEDAVESTSFENIQRYEKALENSIFETIGQLKQLQTKE
jgi:hypothetical protein